jgi:hypothetical protein
MLEKGYAYKILVENLQRRKDHFRHSYVDEKIILQWILERKVG